MVTRLGSDHDSPKHNSCIITKTYYNWRISASLGPFLRIIFDCFSVPITQNDVCTF